MSPNGTGNKPQASRAPWAKPEKGQPKASRPDADLLTHLDQLLSGATLDTALEGPAAALRNQLRLRAPASSQRQKLKSVMDKIDHHKSQIHKSKKRLKEIEAERVALEEQLASLDSGLTLLEQEKSTLCTLVGAGGVEDSASDSGSGPSDDDSEPDDERAEAFLNRLDPVRVYQWAQSKIRRDGGTEPPPLGEHYVIGNGSDADMEGAGGP